MTADVPADRLTEDTAARILALVGHYEKAVTLVADELHTGSGPAYRRAQERRAAAYQELADTVLDLVDWRTRSQQQIRAYQILAGLPASGEVRTATLLIGRSYSKCSACRNGAAPEESAHTTRLDYGDHDGRGCGATYTAVKPDCYGTDADVRAMRPDLPFLPPGVPAEDTGEVR